MADPGALPWGHRPGPGLGALSEVLTLVLSATCGPRWLSSRESPLPSAPQGSSALRGRRRAPAPAELTPDWWRQMAAGERTPGAAGGRGKRPVRAHCLPASCLTPASPCHAARPSSGPQGLTESALHGSSRMRGAQLRAVPCRAASRPCCPVENTAALSAGPWKGATG